MKSSFGSRPRDVLQQTNQNVAGFVGLNNRIYPTACGAVADISLLFVTLLHFHSELFQFFVSRLLVASLASASENRKHSIRRLSRTHHRVARSRPGNDKPRIICLAAHRVIPSAK